MFNKDSLEKQNVQNKYIDFFGKCMDKFLLRAKQHDRSLEPWKEYDKEFLVRRLQEEWEELDEEIRDHLNLGWDGSAIQDELLDIANFAMFLWAKLEDEK